MGGIVMAFVSLFLFWPLLLFVWLLSLLSLALPVISMVLLVWNVLVLVFLLLVRRAWKKSGTMDRAYIDGQTGWRRPVLLILRWGLILFILWEVLLVLASGCLVAWYPMLLEMLL